jgi:hypothetical protein
MLNQAKPRVVGSVISETVGFYRANVGSALIINKDFRHFFFAGQDVTMQKGRDLPGQYTAGG